MSEGVHSAASPQEIRVAKVSMPERGVYLVKVSDGPARSLRPGDRAVVSLDYGEDECEVLETRIYDPSVDGSRVPSYRLLRPYGPKEADASSALADEAARLAEKFAELARQEASDLQVVYSRLAVGRGKLFVRYVCGRPRAAVPRAVARFAAEAGLPVNAWQMGLRDAVSAIGGVGPCGRVCCCAAWMRREGGASRPESGAHAPPGACGRARCCASFEAKGGKLQ